MVLLRHGASPLLHSTIIAHGDQQHLSFWQYAQSLAPETLQHAHNTCLVACVRLVMVLEAVCAFRMFSKKETKAINVVDVTILVGADCPAIGASPPPK